MSILLTDEEKESVRCYKLASPDGFDFYTGNTIQYRGESYPHTVTAPGVKRKSYKVCQPGVLHASVKPSDCFVGARIPCSAFIVTGKPVCGTPEKYGFLTLTVIEEIPQEQLDALFGWRYSEACNPVNPFKLRKRKPTAADIDLLKQWASVWASVGASVWYSEGASVEDPVWAYIGSFFDIPKWKHIEHEPGIYPYQPAVDLWKQGLVPSFDGKLWRLHSGKKAAVAWEGEI